MTRLVRKEYFGGKSHGYELDGQKIVGATTAAGARVGRGLMDWAGKFTAEYAIDHWDELGELPPSRRLSKLNGARFESAGSKAARGTDIHRYADRLSHGEAVDVPDDMRGPVDAVARFLDDYDVETIGAETPVAHTRYRYGGTADLWAHIGKLDVRALLDWKTGKGVYGDVALQLAAYRYTDLCLIDGVEQATPEVDECYVVHVMPDAIRLVPVRVRDREWRVFLYRLEDYRWMQEDERAAVGEAL